jgi:hypothetical protein
MVYKTLHIKVNIEQHESIKNWDELRRSGSIFISKDRQCSGQKKKDKQWSTKHYI